MQPTCVVPFMAALFLAGCANTSGNTSVACQTLDPAPSHRTAPWQGTVFTVVMENHSRGDIIGSDDAPFINSLVKQNALAAGYHDSFVHPSEPNYIWMVSGENFGILNDNDPGPSNHISSTSHLADQIEAAGLTWKSYQENMSQPCGLSSRGEYAAKHNPFVFFDDVNGWDGTKLNPTPRCQEHIVDFSQLDADLAAGKLPDYAFITPNLKNDMHDGSVAAGDAWLAREIPKILSSDAFNQGGVIFLLWDEGGGLPATDDPPFIVISPNAKPGFVSNVSYDTSSFLKTVEKILGLQTLPCASASDSVPSMDDLFTVSLGNPSTGQTASIPPPATSTPPPAPATSTPPQAASTPLRTQSAN